MTRVTKSITRGASYYGQTEAVGDLETVKVFGMMSCGSGDDYCLSRNEREMVENHDPNDGDLDLPDGPWRGTLCKRPKAKA